MKCWVKSIEVNAKQNHHPEKREILAHLFPGDERSAGSNMVIAWPWPPAAVIQSYSNEVKKQFTNIILRYYCNAVRK